MPMPGSAAPKSLPDYLAAVMDRLILAPPQGEGLAFDGTTEGPRPAENLFALCLGSQWLSRLAGSNACCLVPSGGGTGQGPTGSALKTLQSGGARRTLFSLRWYVSIHVWGREPGEEATGRARDVARLREAIQIFENVTRVLYVSASAYGIWDSLSGFQNETEVAKYGELIVASFSVPVPVYDYARTYITLPQVLQPAAGNPAIEGG